MNEEVLKAIDLIQNSNYTFAFTGAGISVESGIPPFRGENGLWSKYDPNILDLDHFFKYPNEAWKVIKELFYDFFGHAEPNAAHYALAELETMGRLQAVVTQNIDNLHYDAGSKEVYEFHGNSRMLVCTNCTKTYVASEKVKDGIPVCDHCKNILKPDFIFFGEGIPELAYRKSVEAARRAEVLVIIGSTGEVYPASQIPVIAKQNGAKVIEVNPERSLFTSQITNVFLQGKATDIMTELLTGLNKKI